MYDRSKLKDGYVFIMENAKNHFQSAEILAEQGFYGLANSHLILSSEEAVKAYIIFAQHYDHDLKIENFEKIFSDHKHKHKLIKEMTFSFAFIEKIMNFFVEPAKALMENDKKNFTKNELMNARNTGLKNLKSWLKKTPNVEHNESWWNNANRNKNRGFYVNFNDNKWEIPKSITKKQYDQSHRIVLELIEKIQMIPKAVNDPRLADFYNKMKESRSS